MAHAHYVAGVFHGPYTRAHYPARTRARARASHFYTPPSSIRAHIFNISPVTRDTHLLQQLCAAASTATAVLHTWAPHCVWTTSAVHLLALSVIGPLFVFFAAARTPARDCNFMRTLRGKCVCVRGKHSARCCWWWWWGVTCNECIHLVRCSRTRTTHVCPSCITPGSIVSEYRALAKPVWFGHTSAPRAAPVVLEPVVCSHV